MTNDQNPAYPAPLGVQPQPQPQPLPVAQAPVPGQLPVYHLPDESAVAEAYRAHKEQTREYGSGEVGPQYVKWPGPTGQTRWDASVPHNFEASVYVYILPPWAPGKGIFLSVRSHFWKSQTSPGGTSIGCPGSDQCLICQAKDAAMHHPDPQIVEKAKNFGRVRIQYLYNVVNLTDLAAHQGKDGVMRPHILGAGSWMHKQLGDIVEDKKGAINIVDPMRGRAIRLKKRKTGREMVDVEYAAIAQDAAPLDPGFYPCLQNIWDLEKLVRTPDVASMSRAVQDMGLPSPGPLSGLGPQVAPAAPFQNPYSAQIGQVGQSQAPVYMPPPADPYGALGLGVQPAPVQQQVWNQPPPMAPAPAPVAPPAMSVPPPVQSAPVQQTGYQPQPGQVPVPPSVVAQAPAAVAEQVIPPAPAIMVPVAAPLAPTRDPVVQTSVAKPPCFGRHNATDRVCQECPGQLKNECMVQPVAQDLAQLQGQLSGQS